MSLKVWHSLLGTAVAVLFAVIFFTDAWNWLLTLIAGGLTAFFGSNLVFASLNRARLSDRGLWNVSEYKNHQDFSLAAAREVWNDEKPGSALELRVKLTGRVEGETAKAPLSASEALAWRLTVDGFRHTKLGAEGDFSPLLDKTWVPRLSLVDADDRAAIEPPARLNAGLFREELTTWDGLDRFPAVKTLVLEALTLQGLKKEQFTGVRLTETRLEAEAVTVYGTLSKTKELTLSGTAVADDPASLLIVADRAKDKRRFQLRRSPVYWVNVALLVVSIPLSALAVMNSPLIPKYEGPVKVSPGGRDLQIDFGADKPRVWTFGAKDTRTLVSLTYESENFEAASSEPLTITVFGGTVTEYGPGREGRLSWSDGHWLIDASRPHLTRSGLLRYRNLTSKKITVSFPSEADIALYWWDLKPHEGQNTDNGNYLVLKDKDLHVFEGTEVSLTAGKTVRKLVVGVSPQVVWNNSLDAWQLDLTDTVLKTPPAALWAVPHPTLHLRGVVTDPDGQTDTFDVPPDTSGEPIPVKSITGDDYKVTDAQVFSLSQTPANVLYHGPLKGYAGTKWNRDHWEITIPRGP